MTVYLSFYNLAQPCGNNFLLKKQATPKHEADKERSEYGKQTIY
jgi:hypothetical protein